MAVSPRKIRRLVGIAAAPGQEAGLTRQRRALPMRIPKPRNLTMTEDLLHEIREGGIAWTTFNRPQARNAMTFAMYARLAELADEISADPADPRMGDYGRRRQGFCVRHRYFPIPRIPHGRGCAELRSAD
jgi:hypothetical protein